MIPPVVEWHLQENSIYGMPGGYAWLHKFMIDVRRVLIKKIGSTKKVIYMSYTYKQEPPRM